MAHTEPTTTTSQPTHDGHSSKDSVQQTTIAISGMSCGGCVSAVRKALEAVPGTKVDAVTVGSATLHYDASRTTPETFAQAIRDAGYQLGTAGVPVMQGAAVPGGEGGCCCGLTADADQPHQPGNRSAEQ